MTEKIGKCHDCTASQTEINMLSRHILELQADKGRLTDKVRELEAQIEKMKCCGNCNNTWNGYHLDVCDDCKNHDKWEIKEND